MTFIGAWERVFGSREQGGGSKEHGGGSRKQEKKVGSKGEGEKSHIEWIFF